MKTSCKFYSFLRAVRGNWRNAIFVSCGCDACMYGREKPCSGFLLTVDERGQVMLLATETIRELTGEEVEPAECSAVLSRRSFDAAFSKYIEWHTPDPSACTLRQLGRQRSCRDRGRHRRLPHWSGALPVFRRPARPEPWPGEHRCADMQLSCPVVPRAVLGDPRVAFPRPVRLAALCVSHCLW